MIILDVFFCFFDSNVVQCFQLNVECVYPRVESVELDDSFHGKLLLYNRAELKTSDHRCVYL